MSPSSDDLIKPLSGGPLAAFRTVDGLLSRAGCVTDVKTIYVSYTLAGEMVAALYPSAQQIEIALALAEEHPSTKLRDATHLTWRTLPVSVVVRTGEEAVEILPLVEEAVERVRVGTHDVLRDNDHFVKAKRKPLESDEGE